MDSLAFLERAAKAKPLPIYVLHGDEDFLKRLVLDALKKIVLGTGDDLVGLSTHAGDEAQFLAVRDELETVPFLSPRRLVIVENADPFVTEFRAQLEKYVGQPAGTGTLVLDVKSWPSNTKLAKLIDSAATIVCKAPDAHRLPHWCVQWTGSRHGKQLDLAAAQLLVELIGQEMGQLDQELTKLAIYVGKAQRIEVDDVDQLVGRSQAAKIFKVFDAIGAGLAGEALRIMDHAFEQGDDPHRILGAFSMQLRRLAQAARLTRHRRTPRAALQEVGVPPFAIRGCEQQLRHLGRPRTEQLYDWLLQTDLGLKGSSQLPPRTLLEKLVVKLAQKS